MGASAVEIVGPLRAGAVWMFDQSRVEDRTETTIVSYAMIAANAVLLAKYYIAYKDAIDDYGDYLRTQYDFIKKEHEFYVEEYQVNKDRLYVYLHDNIPVFPTTTYYGLQNLIRFIPQTADSEKSTQDLINGKTILPNPKSISSSIKSSLVHARQRRLRDSDSFRYAYNMLRYNSYGKYYAYGSTEKTNIMNHYSNAVSLQKGYLTMTARGATAAFAGLTYELDGFLNNKSASSSSNVNASNSETTSTSQINRTSTSRSSGSSINSGSSNDSGWNNK